jgi:glycosyltransferase involved in cell wall biosynthesis
MPRAPRVVMLMRKFYPLTGGYQNQALRLAHALMRRGLPVQVLTHRHRGLATRDVHEDVPIARVAVPGRGYLASASYLAAAVGWLARRRTSFDLIHANRSSSGLVAGVAGRLLAKPVLYKLTRGDEIEIKALGAGLFGRLKLAGLILTVDRFVAITGPIADDLRRLGVPDHRVVTIPNGVEVGRPAPRAEGAGVRSALGWPADAPVATFVGRLVHDKGLDWLLAVWPEVTRRRADARLLLVGDGPERHALADRATGLGLTGRVAFAGRREDVRPYLAASDVFALPSRQEGVANALLEAMVQGLPVVVADDRLGGNREVVTDGLEGHVVRVGDDRGLADALSRLLADPALRRAMGARARRTVEERFSIESVADRYCAIYADLLRQARRDEIDVRTVYRHFPG